MNTTGKDPESQKIRDERSQMVEWASRASNYLKSLGGKGYTESDTQFAMFYLDWNHRSESLDPNNPYANIFAAPIDAPRQEIWVPTPPDPGEQPSRLSPGDYAFVSQKINLEPAILRAFVLTEAAGSGFNSNGTLKMLFEGHLFWYNLKQVGIDPTQYAAKHPSIVYAKWTTKFYLGGIAEYSRLGQAIAINRQAALSSASWGMGQVLGLHWKSLGYLSLDSMLTEWSESERKQLEGIGSYLRVNNLLPAARARDWDALAKGYNGSGYALHGYHLKLAANYDRALREGW